MQAVHAPIALVIAAIVLSTSPRHASRYDSTNAALGWPVRAAVRIGKEPPWVCGEREGRGGDG